MSLIKDGIEALRSLFEDASTAETIHECSDSKILRIPGQTELESFDKEFTSERPVLQAMESFVSYIETSRGDDTNNRSIVFVNDQGAYAQLNYPDKVAARFVSMPFLFTKSFRSLSALHRGVGGKDLWRRLVTDLSGSMDASIAAMVRSVSLNQSSETKVDITEMGLEGGGHATKVRLGFGENATDLPLDYEYKGPVWQCDREREISVKMRLELSLDEGMLLFTFHPIELPTVIEEARNAIVSRLREKLADKGVEVYDGVQAA